MDRLTKRDEEGHGDFYSGRSLEDLWEFMDYEDLWIVQVTDVFDKLADYEDAEEDGDMVILPCKLGSILYTVESLKIERYRVIDWTRKGGSCYLDVKKMGSEDREICNISFSDVGEAWFTTKDEAIVRLNKMEAKYE